MRRHVWWNAPMKESRRRRPTDQGQAMLLVIALIAVLVAVPAAIVVLAVGQVSTTENAALIVQANQAARAGISDYINNVEADPTYTKYCSRGMTSGATQWACPGSTVSAPALTNPAFVNSPTLAGTWYSDGSTMRGVTNGTPSYRYVVNSPDTAIPAQVLIYSIGQAGTAAGQHVSATEEAALTVCVSGCLYPTSGVSCIKVPTNAVSAKIIVYGARGGGGGPDAVGGVGAMVTATVPVTAGDTLDLYPGQPGQAGNPQLLNLLNLLAGAGGSGGLPLSGPCLLSQTYSPPDLGGGNGALPGGLANVLTAGGGGGGGATMVFDATTNNMVAVGGGGGGGGAGNLLQILGGPPGAGGTAGSDPPGSGGTAAGLLLVFPAAPGGTGGTWSAPPGAGLCASTTVAGGTGTAPGNACGQNGYLPTNLLGVLTGGGGGGGGGYSASSLGGGGGGTTGGLLGIAVGSGGGGGAGYSSANNGPCPAPAIVPAAYPTGDATGAGQISITFFAGACGTNPLTTVTGTIRAAAAP
jgi:hypothetical protein